MSDIIKVNLKDNNIIADLVDTPAVSANIEHAVILNGTDGYTPYIGENGNWFINEVDTGQPSQGEEGPIGPQGPQGIQGERGLDGTQGIDGKDGLTTQITVDNTTYTQVDGNIDLPNYPDTTMKQNITENTLITTAKTIPEAINEIRNSQKIYWGI